MSQPDRINRVMKIPIAGRIKFRNCLIFFLSLSRKSYISPGKDRVELLSTIVGHWYDFGMRYPEDPTKNLDKHVFSCILYV